MSAPLLEVVDAVVHPADLEGEGIVPLFDRLEDLSLPGQSREILALDEARRGGRIKHGDLILLVAFGAGLTYGSALIRW